MYSMNISLDEVRFVSTILIISFILFTSFSFYFNLFDKLPFHDIFSSYIATFLFTFVIFSFVPLFSNLVPRSMKKKNIGVNGYLYDNVQSTQNTPGTNSSFFPTHSPKTYQNLKDLAVKNGWKEIKFSDQELKQHFQNDFEGLSKLP